MTSILMFKVIILIHIEAVQLTEAALDDHYVVREYKSMTAEGQANPSVCKMIQTNDIIHGLFVVR